MGKNRDSVLEKNWSKQQQRQTTVEKMFGGIGKKEPEPEPEDEATQLRNMNPDEMTGEQLQQRIANGAQDVSAL